MSVSPRDAFRVGIADHIGVAPSHVTLFSRGRVALYAILRALGVSEGDEVILPAFTCVAVPNAIAYVGARPVWVDIDPRTYTIDPSAVAAAITPRTRVILAQNTFGLSADIEALCRVARESGNASIEIVDDATHGLGGSDREQPTGRVAAVSFFSTQWSKPISTGLGGFAVALDDDLAARLVLLEQRAPLPSAPSSALLRILVFGREHVPTGRVLRIGRAAYRSLGHVGIVPGSSSGDELSGTTMPDGFLAGLSDRQARLGAERIGGIASAVSRRRAIARQYSAWLGAHGRTVPCEPSRAVHTFLRYPVRIRNRDDFMRAAQKAGVDLGDWFVSPVHPVTERLERWGYVTGTSPHAEQACREVVNLPTDPDIGTRDVERVLGLLARKIDMVL